MASIDRLNVQTTGRTRSSRNRSGSVPISEVDSWSPPDFGGHRRTRIGASIVEQFVAGHNPGDVLRELVQNEFDGGGDRLDVSFGAEALDVVGNGRGITTDGWKRLSVIVGTGRVVGDDEGDRVAPKTNGIGSKNFGLRSLFLFGNEIFVRSRGQVCVLDLRTLETGKVRDHAWWGGKGVRLRIPFRQEPFEMLEPFTVEHEARAFEIMAGGMLATLVKLALPGRSPGLREVTLRSIRAKRTLIWRQHAEGLRSPMKGISIVRRIGKITDSRASEREQRNFEEMEFATVVQTPDEYADRVFPAYFKAGAGVVKIAVSVPLARRGLERGRPGHFHYPLQAPDARTGCLIGVSAPFEMDSDRGSLLDNNWNKWLMDEAARLTVELLTGDWFDRFGPAAYEALDRTSPASPPRFIEAVERHLRELACWPSRAAGSERFVKASNTVIVADPILDGFMSSSRYLDPKLVANPTARRLALGAGAATFNLSSLVRLRCAAADALRLKTKLQSGEANWHFENYNAALRDATRQLAMANALTILSRQLSRQNRDDLRSTESTLTAVGDLRPASELILVQPEIWDVCPEPLENRLHSSLVQCRPLASLCREFDEQAWIVEAANRASVGAIDKAEREVLYAKVLDATTHFGRRALVAIRKSPVVRNQRGEWVAPADMVSLKGSVAKLMGPVVSIPSKEMAARPALLAKLKIRDRLDIQDLVAFAVHIPLHPYSAKRFERLLADNQHLITQVASRELADIPFLRTKSGGLAKPASLHLDTPANRLSVADDSKLVADSNEVLYRRLRVREHPAVDTLVEVIADARGRSEPPLRPEIIYPAIVAGLHRERRPKFEFESSPIIWVDGAYYSPSDVVVGAQIPRVLDDAIPVVRRSDELSRAYLSLGARPQAGEEHWTKFFQNTCGKWDGEPLGARQTRVLLEAYRQRGPQGLPDGLDELECLLARNGLLYSREELVAGTLVENDFSALADALTNSGSALGVVDIVDRSRSFFYTLGIRTLSSIAGAGLPVFGEPATKPIWFKSHHNDLLVAMVRRPIFPKALHAVAIRQRHAFPGFDPADPSELATRLDNICGVAFYSQISREFSIGTAKASVPIEAAIGDGVIALVAPRTKLDFQQLVAQALAEVAGAANVAQARALSTAFLPFVLCRTVEEMVVYLERVGVDVRGWDQPTEPELEFDDVDAEELGEEIIRQVMHSLETGGGEDASMVNSPGPTVMQGVLATSPPPESLSQIAVTLPSIDGVGLVIALASDQIVESRSSQSGGWSGNWMPRTTSEMERDREVGLRGEELVYRMELERVRKAGNPDPESVVIWTSRTNPGADHDIQSVDQAGRPLWIEVKSTTGTDGRFDWSRKEFEKAMRERERYELWRVYRAASTEPIAKCFRDPGAMLGASRLQLELGSLRAHVEGMD